MTNDEIKAMIASAITGQGNQVDSGGKLGEILNAIIDAIDAIPAPTPQVQADWGQSDSEEVDYIKHKPTVISAISLSQLPSASMTTQAQLDAIGLTKARIQDAANGGHNAIINNGSLYIITRAIYRSQNNYGIDFYNFILGSNGTFSRIDGYSVTMMDGDITVTVVNV